MADIRQIVKNDRGLLKRFQAFLPGYKKYRNTEDLRTSDSLLRRELGKELSVVEKNIIKAREKASRKMDMESINQIGEMVNISHRITEKVIHAEQGYAPWISGDVRLEEEELQKLYDYDLAMFKWVEDLKDMSSSLPKAYNDGSPDRTEMIESLRARMEEFENVFDQRISEVTDVAQRT